MTTVDTLLKTIINHNPDALSLKVPPKDFKTLKNLARLAADPVFITENQSKLVLKLLSNHADAFDIFKPEVEQAIAAPTWSRGFRVIQHLRKIYINRDLDIPHIIVEYTFSADLQRDIQQLSKTVDGLVSFNHSKMYGAPLTEKNIVAVIEKLKNYRFAVCEELREYYNTIKSWSKTDVVEQYRITTISHPNFEKHIVNDLGIDTAIDENIINDRSVRYQYFPENVVDEPKNLAEMLANRRTAKTWVDKNLFSLENLFKAFSDLKRFPVLVVLDSRDETKCLSDLKNLSESLEKSGIFDNIGVYFRLDNSATGREFNQFIASKKYNSQLNSDTKVVVVQSGKIPKFLLKLDWKPMSVVSINHTLRHSKTAVYSNCCDLVVTYTGDKPIIEARNPWE